MPDNDKLSPPSTLACPRCGSAARFDTEEPVTVQGENMVSIPAVCKTCEHKWFLEIEHISAGVLQLNVGSTELIKLPEDELTPAITPLAEQSNADAFTSNRYLQPKSGGVLIPKPLFWALIVVIVCLVGLGGWLFSALQQKQAKDALSAEAEAAMIVIRATQGAAEEATATQEAMANKATSTAEAKAFAGATATVARAETSIAATATTEWQATGTAESLATVNAAATLAVEQKGTATAESVATSNARATATAEQRATATAAELATASFRATATTEHIGTATAESIATAGVRASATAKWIATATAEARATPTPLPTPTPGPKLNLIILGCNTGFDAAHGMGEVKNAWVTIQNVGDGDASDVETILSANDEAAEHPDKEVQIAYLPPNHQITYKLTVDTTLGTASSVRAVVTSSEGVSAEVSKSSCRLLDENANKLIEQAGRLGEIIVITALKVVK